MSVITIKPSLYQVLLDFKGTRFTIDEITEAYLSHPNSLHNRKKSARQYVYRNIQRLLSTGLSKRLTENRGWPRYELAENFEQKVSGQSALATSRNVIPLIALKERLSQHKSDMLCSIGEAEEYNELCSEHPELREEAQSLYNEARERSATLLGKVRALENLLSQHVSA